MHKVEIKLFFLTDNMERKLKWHHIWFYVDRTIPHIVFKMYCFLLCYQFEYRSHTVGIVKQEYKEILQGNLKIFWNISTHLWVNLCSVFTAVFAILIKNFFNRIKICWVRIINYFTIFLGLYSKITEQDMFVWGGKYKPKQRFCSVVNSNNTLKGILSAFGK